MAETSPDEWVGEQLRRPQVLDAYAKAIYRGLCSAVAKRGRDALRDLQAEAQTVLKGSDAWLATATTLSKPAPFYIPAESVNVIAAVLAGVLVPGEAQVNRRADYERKIAAQLAETKPNMLEFVTDYLDRRVARHVPNSLDVTVPVMKAFGLLDESQDAHGELPDGREASG